VGDFKKIWQPLFLPMSLEIRDFPKILSLNPKISKLWWDYHMHPTNNI
jgi:hypothetical protein